MAKTKTASKTSTASKKPAAKTTKASKAAKAKAAPKRARSKASTKVTDKEATIDRRRKPRRTEEAAKEKKNETPKLERREKVNRRRQIDPTTCERDYSDAEVAFMNALDDYKRKSGRMFPTCSEVLEVIRGLGYVQLSPAEQAARNAEQASNTPEDSLDDDAEAAATEALEESEGLRVMESEFADA